MPEKLNRKAKNESNHLILWPMPNQHKTLTSHRGPLICTVTFVGRRSHHKFVKRPESKEILKEKCAQRWRVTHIWHTGAAFFLFFFLQVRRLTSKLKTGAECRLDRTSFNSTPMRAFSQLSYFCVRFLSAVQKRKDLSLNRLGTKKRVHNVNLWLAVRQWKTVFRCWFSQPASIRQKQEERKERGVGCAIADWVWFRRNTITSRSKLPGAGLCTTCGRSQNDGSTHNSGSRRTSQWELPSWKHEGPNQQLVLHHMPVIGCLNSNSADLLATKAEWKGLLLRLKQETFSRFPLLLCIFPFLR